MARLDSRIVVDVRHVPDLVWDLRREMASILREQADVEMYPHVADRLRRIANTFETGQRLGDET